MVEVLFEVLESRLVLILDFLFQFHHFGLVFVLQLTDLLLVLLLQV